jgi:hypothetical protein
MKFLLGDSLQNDSAWGQWREVTSAQWELNNSSTVQSVADYVFAIQKEVSDAFITNEFV